MPLAAKTTRPRIAYYVLTSRGRFGPHYDYDEARALLSRCLAAGWRSSLVREEEEGEEEDYLKSGTL